ncbi:MAG TPA: SRPBCC family protein [bacterium]|nr:SRPBCC family protein [bacterium]
MAHVSRAVHIDAPRERVFALVADPARIAELDPRVGGVRVERGASGPRRVHLEFAPGAAGSSAEIVADVTRYVAGRDFVMASPAGAPGPAFRLEVSCRDASGGTDLTCEMEIRLPGLAGRMADPLLGAALAQQVGALLARVEREATRKPVDDAATGRVSQSGPTDRAHSSTKTRKTN